MDIFLVHIVHGNLGRLVMLHKRTFNESATYALNRIKQLEIPETARFELLGMVTALQVLHEEEIQAGSPHGKSASQNLVDTILYALLS